MNQIKNEITVIGIDHGYGNIKTAHTCFKTGITCYDTEPTFKSNMLEYGGKFYIIGDGHKEFIPKKQKDNDFYILTLAAIGRELYYRKLTSAKVFIAAGLPLTWVSEQKDSFREYLLQNTEVQFTFKGVDFNIEIVGADIFPQGFSAVAERLYEFSGVNMLCDIGNGTMNVMYINDKKPQNNNCFTEKYGTHQCMIQIKEELMKKFNVAVDENIIENVLRFGTANIGEKYLTAIKEKATEYVDEIFRKLREHEYNSELMRLYIVGGGGCLVKNFGDYDKSRVTVIDDICATAKGYEYLSKRKFQKNGGAV